MECKNCGYFWKEEYERYPSCRFVPRAPGELAPCDQEEEDHIAELEVSDDPTIWEEN